MNARTGSQNGRYHIIDTETLQVDGAEVLLQFFPGIILGIDPVIQCIDIELMPE